MSKVQVEVTIPVYAFLTLTVETDDTGDREDNEWNAMEDPAVADTIANVTRTVDGGISAPGGASLSWGGVDNADFDRATGEQIGASKVATLRRMEG